MLITSKAAAPHSPHLTGWHLPIHPRREIHQARRQAVRDMSLVHVTRDLLAAQAAIFKPPPPEALATATTLGEWCARVCHA